MAQAAVPRFSLSNVITHNRFLLYGATSCALAASVTLGVAATRTNFYAAAIAISSSNGNTMILCNFAFFVTLCVGMLLQRVFFGRLRPIEVEHLYDRSWYFVTESLLALTMFRGSFDSTFVILFGLLLFLKCFHWIAADRVEWMDQVPPPGPPKSFHLRMMALFVFLVASDVLLLSLSLKLVLPPNHLNGKVLFVSEYTILTTSWINVVGKYGVNVWEKVREMLAARAAARARALPRVESDETEEEEEDEEDDRGWEGKSMVVFYIDLVTDFLKLITYFSFFLVILTNYGLPFNILRDVYLTLRSFITRLKTLIQYTRATRNMDERYPDATREEMSVMEDRVCIICREEMVWLGRNGETEASDDVPPEGGNTTAGEATRRSTRRPRRRREGDRPKKLGCNHCFHLNCLKSWLERQQNCPTCRRTVLPSAPGVPTIGGPAIPPPGPQPGQVPAPVRQPPQHRWQRFFLPPNDPLQLPFPNNPPPTATATQTPQHGHASTPTPTPTPTAPPGMPGYSPLVPNHVPQEAAVPLSFPTWPEHQPQPTPYPTRLPQPRLRFPFTPSYQPAPPPAPTPSVTAVIIMPEPRAWFTFELNIWMFGFRLEFGGARDGGPVGAREVGAIERTMAAYGLRATHQNQQGGPGEGVTATTYTTAPQPPAPPPPPFTYPASTPYSPQTAPMPTPSFGSHTPSTSILPPAPPATAASTSFRPTATASGSSTSDSVSPFPVPPSLTSSPRIPQSGGFVPEIPVTTASVKDGIAHEPDTDNADEIDDDSDLSGLTPREVAARAAMKRFGQASKPFIISATTGDPPSASTTPQLPSGIASFPTTVPTPGISSSSAPLPSPEISLDTIEEIQRQEQEQEPPAQPRRLSLTPLLPPSYYTSLPMPLPPPHPSPFNSSFSMAHPASSTSHTTGPSTASHPSHAISSDSAQVVSSSVDPSALTAAAAPVEAVFERVENFLAGGEDKARDAGSITVDGHQFADNEAKAGEKVEAGAVGMETELGGEDSEVGPEDEDGLRRRRRMKGKEREDPRLEVDSS